jgi:hypothetical protein
MASSSAASSAASVWRGARVSAVTAMHLSFEQLRTNNYDPDPELGWIL